MATGNTNVRADVPEVEREEHNSTAQAKDIVGWGFDGTNYVKIAVDSDGKLQLA